MSEKNWSLFKEFYPNSIDKNFHAYPRGINFDYYGMAYDVFMDKIGGPIHHYLDKKLGKALIESLGQVVDGNSHKQTHHAGNASNNKYISKRINNGKYTLPNTMYRIR
jgi:hypothetical protein